MSDNPAAEHAATQADFEVNLASIRARIAAAEAKAGRVAGSVRLLPVTKTVPVQRLRLAIAAGVSWLGENKVQEAWEKSQALADLPQLKYSVIGHLQTNKAKYVARFADEFQALDNLRQAQALERRLEIEDRTLEVFIQVNTSGEESKFGVEPGQAPAFLKQLRGFERLQVKGLMTLAVFSPEQEPVRDCFRRLVAVRDELRQLNLASVEELSMGMSGDFELAIAEGATVVRVGQGIFGARALPDSHYWPGFAG
ncbi:YggS family pyridoxal phosphate-dependent enzyme [Glutamicibacter sp.]|uniref:YggS family pyridoxal phosphate-dependent enzyme n=1 Tax=Glutamicibacter sp. TaxID=1931995 RepID=UPI003D6A247C